MAVLRAQCSFAADTTFPRDRVVITPHFSTNILSDPISGVDADQLAEDLATALDTWDGATAREIKVTMYDAQGTQPVFPSGEAVRNLNASPTTTQPRELACCLSYYADRNIPRHRGRLYIPAFLASPSSAPALKPSTAYTDKIAALVPIFAGLGGADIDWCVWSRADSSARKVEHWWIDDDWDVVRSRGLRPTSRITGTTGG